MKTKHLLILLLLAIAGLAASGYLTARHFQILTEGFEHKSICNFNAKFDCDSVIISSFSKLGPFPVSGLGFIFYAYTFLALGYALLNQEESAKALSFPLLASYPALAFSIYLGLVSSFIIKSYCLFCVSLYVITFLFFICIHCFFPKQPTRIQFLKNFFQTTNTKESNMLRSSFFGQVTFLIIFFFISSIALAYKENKYAQDIEDFDHKSFLDFHFLDTQNPAYVIDTQNRPYWGNPAASVKIVEFSDFECPHCKRAALTLKPYLKEHQQDVQLIYMTYPLDKSCNANMQRDLHQNACKAAEAAYCANDQGQFWEMHDKIFENQTELEDEKYILFAKELKLDEKKFSECLNSHQHLNEIKSNIEEGNKANVKGTPSVFINGRMIQDWLNPIKIKLLINEEKKRNKAHAK